MLALMMRKPTEKDLRFLAAWVAAGLVMGMIAAQWRLEAIRTPGDLASAWGWGLVVSFWVMGIALLFYGGLWHRRPLGEIDYAEFGVTVMSAILATGVMWWVTTPK